MKKQVLVVVFSCVIGVWMAACGLSFGSAFPEEADAAFDASTTPDVTAVEGAAQPEASLDASVETGRSDADATPGDAQAETSLDASVETGGDADPPVDAQPEAEASVDAAPPIVPTCQAAGGPTLPTTVRLDTGTNASGGLYVHFQEAAPGLNRTGNSPALSWSGGVGRTLPAQAVFFGTHPMQASSFSSAGPLARLFYKVDKPSAIASIPSCGVVVAPLLSGFQNLDCREGVAKAFRCQYPPYLEVDDCPPAMSFTALASATTYTSPNADGELVLQHLTCSP